LCSLRDEKDFVVSGEFLFGQRRFAVRLLDDLTAPFSYFPAKHADEIAVQLNGIDYVKGEKQQTNAGEIKDNLVDGKRQITPRGG